MEKCLSLLMIVACLNLMIRDKVNCVSLGAIAEKDILEKWHHLFGSNANSSSSRLGEGLMAQIEDRIKYENFKENYLKVLAHNNEFAQNKRTFEVGLNQFAAFSHEDFKNHFLGKLLPGRPKPANTYNMSKPDTLLDSQYRLTAYSSFDWRSRGIISPVKQQGYCGGCWAFAASGAVEALFAKNIGRVPILSEQELIDCTTDNQGCDGGFPSNGLDHAKQIGLVEETQYPFTYKDGYCRNVGGRRYKINGFADVPEGNEEALKQALLNYGPIAIAIDASDRYFTFYKSGVFTSNVCNADSLNHAVLLVGYGTDQYNGGDYWLIKNSWGTQWGLAGYAKIARNRNNMCGIATLASYPY